MISAYLYYVAQVVIDKKDLGGVPTGDLKSSTIQNVLKLVFGFAGAIAFLIVTFGGFKYVISQGDPAATNKAKNTILYALIGLVVCTMAFSIVTFVIGKV